jgi:hypothetical protein
MVLKCCEVTEPVKKINSAKFLEVICVHLESVGLQEAVRV